ncbi:MAG: DUF4394 domain-containing protein [Deltaproteobacteria bacterium]|nr:DUF4394 domain-containing protein [Deltaproteobacteria bacterium]
MNSSIRRALGVLVALVAACGTDDDGPSTLTVDVQVPSGEGGGDVIITAHRTGGSGGSISLSFATLGDSAVETSDFVASSGSVEWGDGDTESKTITIPLVDDVIVEPSEMFVVELDPSSGAELETRIVEATIVDDDGPGDKYAVTSAGRLVHFAANAYGRLSWALDITGLGTEKIIGIDFRPVDGKLYALTAQGSIYTLDPTTGVAARVSTLAADPADTTSPFTALPGAELGVDFDPVTDRMRIVSSTGQNLRVDVDTGRVTTDAAINGTSTGFTALAHNNNIAPACRTTLYAIDVATNRFLTQSPNTGAAVGVGGLGFDATATSGFDVFTGADGKHTAVALLTVDGVTGSYAIDLGSGKGTLQRFVGPLEPGETIVSFALPPLPASSPVTQREGDFFAVTATDVISFTRAAPEKLCSSKPIMGLDAGEIVVGADLRTSTGVLYALTRIGTAGKLHRLDSTSGNVSPAIPISVPLQGTVFGMDFHPTGVLRIVSNTGQNLRVTDADTGVAMTDSPLNGAGTAAEAAYTDALPGAATGTLYILDATADRLRIQNPPNSGTLIDVGPLGVDITGPVSFDIDGRNNIGTVVATVGSSSQLHTMDLATGALSPSLGTIAGGPVLGITRATPETNLYGITEDNRLVRISLTNPSMVTVMQDPMAMPPVDTIAGLATNEQLVGIDVRPNDGIIYGVGNLGGVYTINSFSARANNLGKLAADPMDTSNPFTAMNGAAFGMDFDPTGTGALRVVSTSEQNLRIPNLMMPRVFTDGALTSTTGPTDAIAAAYTNSYMTPQGPPASTTLYVIDGLSGQLMIQSPTSGALTVVGPLAASGAFYDPAMPSHSGFDIAGGNNGIALAAFRRKSGAGTLEAFSRLYRIDLATGAATEIGNGIGGAPLRGLAIHVR